MRLSPASRAAARKLVNERVTPGRASEVTAMCWWPPRTAVRTAAEAALIGRWGGGAELTGRTQHERRHLRPVREHRRGERGRRRREVAGLRGARVRRRRRGGPVVRTERQQARGDRSSDAGAVLDAAATAQR